MPDIFHTLANLDKEMLKIIAGRWGLTPISAKQIDLAKEMASAILAPGVAQEIVESMPADARDCLAVLSGTGGALHWDEFLRRYGAIREMGIARRNRETPYAVPASVAEVLWYHGLIGRAFLKEGEELQEMVYIPDELLEIIPPKNMVPVEKLVAPLDQNMLPFIYPADDRILDHLTSYLAIVRSGGDPHDLAGEFKQPSLMVCEQLLICIGALNEGGDLQPETIRDFLANPRGEALCLLFSKWQTSRSFNELRLMPGIIAEGTWKNDPLKARKILMQKIQGLDPATWWGIDSFVSQIKTTNPDYQRSAGEYESWMIRSEKKGESLRGFENWDKVDGVLIRYLIQGPLHWLGFLDLGGSTSGTSPDAFRLSNMAGNLSKSTPPVGVAAEVGHVTALRNGKLTCPRDVPRAVRYQLARFCQRDGVNDKGYLYQITNTSLKLATSQGLKIEQLITLLARHSAGALPASLVTALQRWARNGIQASLSQVVILRVSNPEILAEIRNSPVARFMGEPLNPTTVVLPAKAIEKIIPRLMELGYICELEDGSLLVMADRE
jgi:hypothetical protein